MSSRPISPIRTVPEPWLAARKVGQVMAQGAFDLIVDVLYVCMELRKCDVKAGAFDCG